MRTLKVLASPAFVLLFAACAQSTVPHARWSETLSDGDTLVLLRYAPEDDEAARQAQRALRTALPVAARWGALPPRITVTIHPTHESLEAAAHREGHPWLRAWARADSIEVESPRGWSLGAASDAELGQLLAHELTHCALYSAIGSDPRRARSVPLWFWEGMATTNAGERFPTVHRSAMNGESLTITAVLHGSGSPLVYATAYQAFEFLVQRYGQARIHHVLARVRDGAEFPVAFQEVLGIGLQAFEREFEDYTDQERTRG